MRINNMQDEHMTKSVSFLFLFSTPVSLREYQADVFESFNSNLLSGLNQLFPTTEGTGLASSSSVYVACRPEVEGLVLESKSFLHWSQWECHHWLHGNNLPLWILDNFWIVWNLGGKGWHMLFQSGPRLTHEERHSPKKQICCNFSRQLSLRPHLHENEISVLYLLSPLFSIYFCFAGTVFFKTH